MNETVIPKWFKVIAVIALVWNAIGVMAFVMQMLMTSEMMAELPKAQQDLYATQPSWLELVFGGSVFAGLLGSLGLVLKKTWALPLLIISLVCLLAQNYYMYFMSNMVEVMGAGAMVMPTIVLLIAVFLVWLAWSGRGKGWLT
ncbi:MAG: hypothetical protein AB8G18_15570 [Gammaproteobacteria bacterium]